MTNTILRIPNGVTLSDAFRASIQSTVGNISVEETYTKEVDTQKHIQRRIESLKDAFIFLVNANPPPNTDKAQLIAFAEKAYANVSLAKGEDLSVYKSQLKTFTLQLTKAIETQWQVSEKEAIKRLNKAEQYNIATRPRDAIATVVKLSDNQFFLAYDTPKPALHPDTVKEMHTIKATPDFIIPAWFNELDDLQKLYIHSLPIDEHTTLDDIKRDFEELKNALNNKNTGSIKPHHLAFINVIKTPPYNNSYEASLLSLNTFIRTQKDNTPFMEACLSLKQRPLWFFYFDAYEQALLQHLLKGATDEAINTLDLSSRLRTIPGLANHLEHYAYLFDEQGNKTAETVPKERSSHPSSRDVKDAPFWIGNTHVKRNLELITAGHADTLIQTLISPIIGGDAYLPDPYLHQNLVEEAKNHPGVMHTNHPLNPAQLFKSLGSLIGIELVQDTDAANIDKLLQRAREVLKNESSNKPALQGLLDEYEHVKETYDSLGAYYARQLVLSSLEQLIAMYAGIHSAGACVSGKDRKAVELMHSDSEWIYFINNQCWPKFQEPNKAFVNNLVALYTSGHQQALSDQNAPGSFGIKSPNKYLPGAVIEALTALGCNLDEDDEMADLNEVKAIVEKITTTPSTSPIPPKTNHITLSPEQQKEFLSTLLHLTSNCAYLWTKLPSGAEKIQAILGQIERSNIDKINQILKVVHTSLLTNPPTRAGITTSFYTAIKCLAIDELKAFNPYENKVRLIPKDKRVALIKQLQMISGEDTYWQTKTNLGMYTGSTPTSIGEIKAVLKKTKSDDITDDTSIILLAKILWITQPTRFSILPRSTTTEKFYEGLQTLYTSEIPMNAADALIQQLGGLEDKITQYNEMNGVGRRLLEGAKSPQPS